jgi:uncharacterized DUF497 family protein
MRITFDPVKRARTLQERKVDFEDAAELFAGQQFQFEDNRSDYGERRFMTIGRVKGRLVAVVWTPRGDGRHVISMRKCNDREQARYGPLLR